MREQGHYQIGMLRVICITEAVEVKHAERLPNMLGIVLLMVHCPLSRRNSSKICMVVIDAV